jgi:AraC-like DNA-binding protein
LENRLTRVVSDFELLMWDGGCVFIGSNTGVLPLHAHQAIQVCFGRTGHIRLRPSDTGPWNSYRIGIVASQQPHAFDATDVPLGAVLFVEPETREGRALAELYLAEGFGSVDPAIAASAMEELFDRFLTRQGDTAIIAASREVIRQLTRGIEPLVISDDRIVRAAAWINDHLEQPISLDDVAAAVFLSPGRFRHLFVEQTGMGLRPYVLWRRFLRVWAAIMNGRSISAAAHEAGFADAAHLTRTSRRMFGVSPSMFRASHSPDALDQAPPAARP